MTIKGLVQQHRHRIIISLALSGALFLAMFSGYKLGIGGIVLDPLLLLGGFVLAEVGRSLTCFGQQSKHWWLEHGGVFLQGLAWWVWVLNLPFLEGQAGLAWWFHLLAPALLLGLVPVLAHIAMKNALQAARLIPEDKDRASAPSKENGEECQH